MADSTPKSPERPNIVRFHDYREFLREWLRFLKASHPGFSLRTLTRDANLALGYLPMVLSGNRKLSNKAWAKLCPHLRLTPKERDYFEKLRLIADGNTLEARKAAFEKIQRSGVYRKTNPNELEVYRYLTHWYYVAIRELSILPDFSPDPKWIQSRLRGGISIKEIDEAIKFLLQYGYLEILPDHKVKLRERNIQCIGNVYRAALAEFHQEMLHLAADSITNTPRPYRMITGQTMAIPKRHYEKLKIILDKTLREIMSLETSSEKPDSVYHVLLATFPLTKMDNEPQTE